MVAIVEKRKVTDEIVSDRDTTEIFTDGGGGSIGIRESPPKQRLNIYIYIYKVLSLRNTTTVLYSGFSHSRNHQGTQ